MDLFTEKYPVINKMYLDYIQTDEYAKHPLEISINSKISESIDEAIQLIKNADKSSAIDVMLATVTDYELTGFILGFTYLLNLIKEVGITKELAKWT